LTINILSIIALNITKIIVKAQWLLINILEFITQQKAI
jgi:hypothetical protein